MSNTIENFFWDVLVCPACGCLMEDHKNTGNCEGCSMSCYNSDFHLPFVEPKVRVYQERDKGMNDHVWRGGCTACFELWSYWHPGAALGFALHHVRSCSRFRYALSLVTPRQSALSSIKRRTSSSGRQRDGGTSQARPPWEVPPLPPEGFKVLTEAVNAPFGRCVFCKTPLTFAFNIQKGGMVRVCQNPDHPHGG